MPQVKPPILIEQAGLVRSKQINSGVQHTYSPRPSASPIRFKSSIDRQFVTSIFGHAVAFKPRSTSMLSTPFLAKFKAVMRPTGPAPMITTGAHFLVEDMMNSRS